MKLSLSKLTSPLGELVIAVRDEVLCALEFSDEWVVAEDRLQHSRGPIRFTNTPPSACIVSCIEGYFDGEVEKLGDLVIDCSGTPFQERVWSELRKISPGHTATYREIAERVGSPYGFRAIGMANRVNPIALVIPCHRVLGSDGGLCGYAGGLERKRWLLAHEARYARVIASPTLFDQPVLFRASNQ